MRSQALHLAVAMDKEPSQFLPQACELEQCLRRLERLCVGTRVSATGKAALMLRGDLAAKLVAELSA